MSHQIEFFDYPENVDKGKVEKDLDNYVSKQTWQEGGGGLPNVIQWKNHICNSENSAEEYINQLDKNGWYNQIAVKYRCSTEKTKKLLSLQEKQREAQKKLTELSKSPHFASAKAELISCKKCSSKISKKYLNQKNQPNHCPVCGSDLRPETVLKKIEILKNNYNKIEKDIQAEQEKINQKGKIRWIVKIEYHL